MWPATRGLEFRGIVHRHEHPFRRSGPSGIRRLRFRPGRPKPSRRISLQRWPAPRRRSRKSSFPGKLDSLSQLRKALDRAEDRVYERYNEINQGSDYDIECITEAPLGSRQKVKKCQPRYVSDALHEDAFDVLFRNQNSATKLRSVSALAVGKQSFLRQAMLEAAQKDAQMQRAMIEHSLLRERYESRLKEKLGKRRIVWD